MKKYILLLVIAIQFIGSVLAHPHVFITPKVCLHIDGYNIEKISIDWVFDRMTSISMIEYLDSNENGKLDVEEIKGIKEEIFPSLSEYDYYIFMFVDNKKICEITPENFTIKINEDDILIYRFDIPINISVKKQFSVFFEDKEIYTAFDFLKENFTIIGEAGEKIDLPVEERSEDYSTRIEIEF